MGLIYLITVVRVNRIENVFCGHLKLICDKHSTLQFSSTRKYLVFPCFFWRHDSMVNGLNNSTNIQQHWPHFRKESLARSLTKEQVEHPPCT